MADRQDSAGRESTGSVPGGLPLYTSGWGTNNWDFEPGEAFWSKIEEITAEGSMSEAMDAAMEGKSSPRVWLILHEPGQPELAAAAALAFARELGGRDQAALVLDCDDQSQSLTRWAGRLEHEGWIDLARYGTSVMTSSVSMPFNGRRGYLLGVGSFAPTDVTPEEIRQLVGRLRRQADDLILVAPADQIGAMWAPLAGIRLLCWDRASRSAADMEGLIAPLIEIGSGLTGLVGVGLPKAAPVEKIVPEIRQEEIPAEVPEDVPDEKPEEVVVEAAEDIPAPVLDDRPDPDLPEPEDDGVDPAGFTDDFVAPDGSETEGEFEAEGEDGWTEAPAFEASEPVRKGTSGVFWFAATAAVVIVAILGVYWFKYVRVPKDGHFQPIELASDGVVEERVPGDRSQGDIANHDDSPLDETDSSGAAGTAVDSVVVAEQSSPETVADEGADEGAGQDVEQATQQPTQQSVETVSREAEAEPETEAEVAVPVFDKAPYLTTVGADGWALHLYSFPSSESANAELTELKRRGFETEIRVVETQEKGRWWRIYVGSFATRIEARDAAPLLKEKLRTDWANPTRF